MRRLPNKLNLRQKLIIEATKDFLGEGCPVKGFKRTLTNIALWVMNRKKGIRLDNEELDAVWYIRQNLSDGTYRNALNFKLNKGFGKEV